MNLENKAKFSISCEEGFMKFKHFTEGDYVYFCDDNNSVAQNYPAKVLVANESVKYITLKSCGGHTAKLSREVFAKCDNQKLAHKIFTIMSKGEL